MRLLNIVVICTLIVAASLVYKIKFDSTLQAERVAKIRNEIRRERDAIALLRAEAARLETPARIEALVKRHLSLRPIDPIQFDNFEQLPERPKRPEPQRDPIGVMLGAPDAFPTGSIPMVPR